MVCAQQIFSSVLIMLVVNSANCFGQDVPSWKSIADGYIANYDKFENCHVVWYQGGCQRSKLDVFIQGKQSHKWANEMREWSSAKANRTETWEQERRKAVSLETPNYRILCLDSSALLSARDPQPSDCRPGALLLGSESSLRFKDLFTNALKGKTKVETWEGDEKVQGKYGLIFDRRIFVLFDSERGYLPYYIKSVPVEKSDYPLPVEFHLVNAKKCENGGWFPTRYYWLDDGPKGSFEPLVSHCDVISVEAGKQNDPKLFEIEISESLPIMAGGKDYKYTKGTLRADHLDEFVKNLKD